MEGSPRSNLVAEAWPATDLEEGTAALTSCLLSSLRLVGNLTSNEVRELVRELVLEQRIPLLMMSHESWPLTDTACRAGTGPCAQT